MEEILTIIHDNYLALLCEQLDLLSENSENVIAEYWRKIYFAKHIMTRQALLDYNNGLNVDLNDLAKRLESIEK